MDIRAADACLMAQVPSTQLLAAASDGDVATVRTLLTVGGVDVNMANEDGWSPLMIASEKGHLDVVKTLIEAGANVNHTNKNNATPLYVASQSGHHDVVQTLLGAGADVNIAKCTNATPLYVASHNGHHDVVQTLLGAGADVNKAVSDINATPLHVASEKGHHDVVQTLVGAGADVNIAKCNNETPLYVASHNGHNDVVQTLLGAGADVNIAISDDGWSPLMIASEKGNLDIVKTLVEAGANVNHSNKNGWSPLMKASQSGHLFVLKTLIEAGADVNHTNKNGNTAFDVACGKGRKEVNDLLKTSTSKINILMSQQLCYVRQELRLSRQRAEAQLRDHYAQLMVQTIQQTTKQLHDLVQRKDQEIHDLTQQKEQSKQELTGLKEQKEQELHDLSQQKEQEIHDLTQQKEQKEQELTDLRQQKEKDIHDIRQQMESYEQQAQRAEERAIKAEQELSLSRQHAEEQMRGHLAQLTVQHIPQSSDYLKSSWRVQSKEIQVIEGRPLGVGAWGEVRVATFRGMKVAAKFIHESIISPHNIDLFIREMNIAACVRHPNLLLFIGASLDEKKPVIITELMQANLRNNIRTLSRDHVISIGTDVAYALNYLHLMKPDPIIHRDVSSANVLLEPIGSGNWRAKVSDYGSANFVSMVTTTGPGNASYAAPESSNPKAQSPKMDVYSYGILLLEMATGQFPDHKLQATWLKTLLWQKMAVLVRKCISEDPSSRIDMKDVLLILPQLNK